MFDVEFKVDFSAAGGLDHLIKDIRDAEAAACREVARAFVIPPMRTALSFAGARPTPLGQLGTVSGRTRRQLRVKVFRGRDGLTNASIKVRGDRAHIARFGEEGTKRQPARKMFETVGRLLRTTIEQQFVAAFERNMKAKGYK